MWREGRGGSVIFRIILGSSFLGELFDKRFWWNSDKDTRLNIFSFTTAQMSSPTTLLYMSLSLRRVNVSVWYPRLELIC